MGAWGEPVTVGKAWDREKNAPLAGAGMAAAGLGVVRGGAELEHRARKAPVVEASRAQVLYERTGAALRHAGERKGKKPEKIIHRGLLVGEHSVAQQREWAAHSLAGAKASERRARALERVMPAKVSAARKVKAGGLGLAALGAGVGINSMRRTGS